MIIRSGIRRGRLGFSARKKCLLSDVLLKGFTLIETFVAIAILATALAGALSLVAQGFNSADIAGDQITASFLAQDGVEYVRFLRDSARLSAAPWLANLSNCVSSSGTQYCYSDSSQGVVAPSLCGSANNSTKSSCPVMNYDTSTGFYNYKPAAPQGGSATNNPTKFTRAISIVTPIGGNADDANVTVYIDWQSRGVSHEVQLQENLFDWQP